MTDDERAFEAYSKISEQIEREDARLNERMTWGLSINGALLAFFGVLGGMYKDVLPHPSTSVAIFVCAIAAFLSIIALLVCDWTINGVQDARKQIYYIRKVYDDKWKTKIENELSLPRPFGSRDLYDKTIHISRWWGDDLFRVMRALWLIILGCLIFGAFYVLHRGELQ